MQGQIIQNRYRLDRLIGKGGMGSVWLAEHLSLHTPVAIKLIDSEAAKNPNARARFDREAQVAARIRSAHVVKVLDHGVTDDGQPYIAMECLAGESLRDRLTLRGRLSPAETGKVVSHVGRALVRAHEAGLVHRDLKPENIFIAREDDQEIVKILDFGVAKVADSLAVSGMDPTRTGALLGTPYYMSPEQAQGLKSVDFRSDLWSLAVVAFECLTGKRPFTAPALGPLIGKILGAPLPVLSHAAPDAGLPADLDAWMAQALARDPAARFGSAKDLADSFLLAAGVADTLDRGFSRSPVTATAAAAPVPSPAVEPAGAATFTGTVALDADDLVTLAVDPLVGTGEHPPSPVAAPALAPLVGTGERRPSPVEAPDLAPSVAQVAVAARGPRRPVPVVIMFLALVLALCIGVLVLVVVGRL
jgi:serine/threonine protein kinase